MTREEFRMWAKRAREMFAAEGLTCLASRSWADDIRPHDSELAALYVRVAEVNEAIRKHLADRSS